MTKFADQLFTDLMQEHGPMLDAVHLPQRRPAVPRPVWLAAGVVGMAGAITAGVTIAGGGSPAYAVTDNGDGTVTVSIDQLTGVDGANGALRTKGDRVAVVPVRAGCPSFESLPVATPGPSQHPEIVGQASSSSKGGSSNTITIGTRSIPAGDVVLIAAIKNSNGIGLAMELIKAPAPSCVSDLPSLRTGSGPTGGTVGGSANMGATTSTGH